MRPAVGVYLPQRGMDRSLLDAAREAEQLGFRSVAVLDHVVPLGAPMGTPILECFTALAAAAAVTDRIGLRTLVVRANARPPVMSAHLARTVEALAPGRLVLGIGAGDGASRREDDLLGLPSLPAYARRDRVRDLVAAMRERLPDVPLWVGGASQEMQQLAGELGDGWNVWAATPDEVRAGAATAIEAAAAAGRAAPMVTWAGQVLLGGDERLAAWRPGRAVDRERVLLGGPDGVATRLRALGAAGVREAVVAFVGGAAAEQRREFAREVLPLL